MGFFKDSARMASMGRAGEITNYIHIRHIHIHTYKTRTRHIHIHTYKTHTSSRAGLRFNLLCTMMTHLALAVYQHVSPATHVASLRCIIGVSTCVSCGVSSYILYPITSIGYDVKSQVQSTWWNHKYRSEQFSSDSNFDVASGIKFDVFQFWWSKWNQFFCGIGIGV